jgi:hypothetical protein
MRDHRKTVRLLPLEHEVPNAIRASADRPVFVGDASVDYACGVCGSALCVGMRDGDLAGLAFVCTCGSANLVPITEPAGQGVGA